jgi:hypothetical protein
MTRAILPAVPVAPLGGFGVVALTSAPLKLTVEAKK